MKPTHKSIPRAVNLVGAVLAGLVAIIEIAKMVAGHPPDLNDQFVAAGAAEQAMAAEVGEDGGKVKYELTEKERACIGPRQLKVPGSVEWCYQTIEVFKARKARKEATDRLYQETLEELVKYQVWQQVPPERPYGSFEAMIQAE